MTTLTDEVKALVGLMKFHKDAASAALQAARLLHSQQNRSQTQNNSLIVRIPVQRLSTDPRYVSDYGYRGMKPYEQCIVCNRKFQIQRHGNFGAAHNKYCPGVTRAIRKLRRMRMERSGG